MVHIQFFDYVSDKGVGYRYWPAVPATGDMVSLKAGIGTPDDYRGKVSFVEWRDDGTAEIHLLKASR